MEAEGVPANEGGTVADVRSRSGETVFGHAPFSGTYRTKLEASGRLVLPSALRSAFAPGAGAGHLFPRRNQGIWLFTKRSFEVFVDTVIAEQGQGLIDPSLRPEFYAASPAVVLDRQHRFVIPPELRGPVGLEGEVEVVLKGSIERIEIIPAPTHDAANPSRLDMLNRLLDGHGGLATGPA